MEIGEIMTKILIIEDDIEQQKELKRLLSSAGYEAILTQKFSSLLEEVKRINPNLILMDINLPFTNGELFLKELRKSMDIPVIMVTSKNNEVDEVLSMSYGADDYITKPYNPTILLLRIEAILKRLQQKNDFLTLEELQIFPDRGIIKYQDKEILLTKNEMLILKLLVQNRGKIVSREKIMDDLWNSYEFVDDNTLTVNISRLRAKLSEIGYESMIQTRKKQGYILL